MKEIYEKIGDSLSLALPGFHACFGCDYLAAFSRKGKIRPLKLLEQDVAAQEAFAGLGECTPEVATEDAVIIEKFLCAVYGKKNLSSIDEVRLHIFADKYKPKKENQCITNVKKLDGSSMAVRWQFEEKVKRTSFVASRWLSSIEPLEPPMSPLDYGWKLVDGQYRINWFDGEAAPNSLDIILNDDDGDNEEIEQVENETDDEIEDSSDENDEDIDVDEI